MVSFSFIQKTYRDFRLQGVLEVTLNSKTYDTLHRRLTVEEATASVSEGGGLQGITMKDSDEEEEGWWHAALQKEGGPWLYFVLVLVITLIVWTKYKCLYFMLHLKSQCGIRVKGENASIFLKKKTAFFLCSLI